VQWRAARVPGCCIEVRHARSPSTAASHPAEEVKRQDARNFAHFKPAPGAYTPPTAPRGDDAHRNWKNCSAKTECAHEPSPRGNGVVPNPGAPLR